MATIHISEAEAVRDFAGVMQRVRAGDDVIVSDVLPAVKLSAVPTLLGRRISESIALAEQHAKELGYSPSDGRGVRSRSKRDYRQSSAKRDDRLGFLMPTLLDTSIVIAGERRRFPVEAVLREVHDRYGDTVMVLSSITVVGFAHGIARERTSTENCGDKHFATSSSATWPCTL